MNAPSNANTSGLAPCPFCGGAPGVRQAMGEAWVVCGSCSASTQSKGRESVAFDLWNRRVTPASPLPVGGQLSKNLGELKSEQCSGISGELKSPDLGALEKLADEATPGEWTIYETGRAEYKNLTWYVERNPPCDHPFISEVQVLPNAAFIAAANPATIKALIAELRDACSTVEELLYAHTDKSIAMGEAFLARNGKGEG